jgi:response regulator RpfG family c-di-GMP phosphodiesterase
MIDSSKSTILIVGQRLESESDLTSIIAREEAFEIHQTNDWRKGLSLSNDIKPDVILCDGTIPWPNVLDLCKKLRDNPELLWTVLIVFGFPDSIEDKENGLDVGINDWIEKSAPPTLIIEKLKTWLRTRNYQKERWRNYEELQAKNSILQTNFKELTIILVKILDAYLPGINDHAKTSKAIAEYISEKLNLEGEEKNKIVFGALLHEVGKVGLHPAMVEKAYHDLNVTEKEIFSHHPSVGSMIISSITGFKDSANAVYHQLENCDGSGMPDGLMGDEIPIGAKIIRAIVLQEELFKAGFSTDEVIDHMKESLNKALDPSVADHLINYLEERDRNLLTNKIRLNVDELETGMILAEDVYSASGIKLLPRGVTIQEKMVKILTERNSADPIIGGIYVFKD